MKATNVNFVVLFGADSPTATKTTSFPGAISLKKALKVTTIAFPIPWTQGAIG